MKIEDANTKYIGKKIKHFEQIESTHLYAQKIAEQEKEGLLILADMQTGGIGTKGRKWYTGKREKYSNDNYPKTQNKTRKIRWFYNTNSTMDERNNKGIIWL